VTSTITCAPVNASIKPSPVIELMPLDGDATNLVSVCTKEFTTLLSKAGASKDHYFHILVFCSDVVVVRYRNCAFVLLLLLTLLQFPLDPRVRN
jgi:hypothetical protein